MKAWKTWVLRVVLAIALIGAYVSALQVVSHLRGEFAKPVTLTFQLPLPSDVAQKFRVDPNLPVEKVMVTGDFSDWSTNDPIYEMRPMPDGTWKLPLTLPAGDNEYKFIITPSDGGKQVWTHDAGASRQVSDTFNGYNSVFSVPNMDNWSLLVHVVLLGGLLMLLLYSILDPLIRWMQKWKIPVRYKLVGALFVTVLFSNAIFLFYNQIELREMSKLGLEDSLSHLHNALYAEQVDFENLKDPETISKIRGALRKFFYISSTRQEKEHASNGAILMANVAVFGPDLKLLVAMAQKDQSSLQTARAIKNGFRNANDFFEKGQMAGLIQEALDRPHQRILRTGQTTKELLASENPELRQSIETLGFNLFLQPIVIRDRIVGYYGGEIHTTLLADETQRVLWFNLYLILMVALLSTLLYRNLGKALTNQFTELTRWTESIKAGHYDEVHTLDSGDEIQKLGENFDHMRQSLKTSMEKLQVEAYRDTLTKMPNRKSLIQDLQKPQDRALVLLNIDSFQEINDYFSSEFGDFVLIETARRLQELTKGTPIHTYKIGSDEYVLLLEGNRPREALEALAQSVCDTIMQQSYSHNKNEVYISLSAGMAQFSQEQLEPEREYRASLLLAEADMALKKAKNSPRRLLHYDKSMEMDREYGRNFLWTSKIRQALNEGRIVPYYQPIVNNVTQQVDKYECLVRMIDTDGTVISPGAFLQISKKSRFYRFITMAMVEKSLETFEHLPYEFSLNLGIEDILDEKTQAFLFEKLAQYPQACKRLVFEIVETDSLDNYTDIRGFIKKVRPLGCKIAIDDFGSGYSNFEHLLQLEIDYLKIDASLIKTMDVDTNAQIITRAISHFAQDLGIKTVAEFVHSKAVYLKACELRLDYSQGYFWGQPQAAPLPAPTV